MNKPTIKTRPQAGSTPAGRATEPPPGYRAGGCLWLEMTNWTLTESHWSDESVRRDRDQAIMATRPIHGQFRATPELLATPITFRERSTAGVREEHALIRSVGPEDALLLSRDDQTTSAPARGIVAISARAPDPSEMIYHEFSNSDGSPYSALAVYLQATEERMSWLVRRLVRSPQSRLTVSAKFKCQYLPGLPMALGPADYILEPNMRYELEDFDLHVSIGA